ncbi:hypothetical protein, partial [Klebsiella sp. X1-16S-Nf21]|uniref:hypothetical protein n=1 Tax=Klebsiella sp. X1-16S-Nf21 TaxID=2057804 RepID=UPI0019816DF8
LKIRREQHFMTITPPTQRYYCAPDGNVHGQDIFETLFQSPNHERTGPERLNAIHMKSSVQTCR